MFYTRPLLGKVYLRLLTIPGSLETESGYIMASCQGLRNGGVLTNWDGVVQIEARVEENTIFEIFIPGSDV